METMLNWLWQGGVIGLAALLMLRALEHARANVRYTVCWAATLAILLLPVVPVFQSTPVAPGVAGVPTETAVLLLPSTWWTSTLAIIAAWAGWASIQCVRFVLAVVAIRRARASSQPFPLDLELTLPHWRRVQRTGRRARLAVSESVGSAAVLGWGHPRIVVAPAVVNTLNADDLDRILVHEWAHVQRRDDLLQLLEVAVRVVAGWHPAIWLLERRLHVEREIACDETTVVVTGSAKSYAKCLMRLSADRRLRTMSMAPAVLIPSGLHARVVKILSPDPSLAPVRARGIAASIIAVLCLVCVNVSGVKMVEAAAMALPFASEPSLDTAGNAAAAIADPTPAIGSVPVPQLRRQASLPASSQPVSAVQRQSSPEPEHANAPEHPNGSAPPDPRSSAIVTVNAPPEQSVNVPAADAAQAPVSQDKAGVAPASTSTAATESEQTPWRAAAEGGATIGRKSKDAGVATAGFFSRVAKRVAASF
jgi:beta-lactamase regulating signal transducer with metallopeptidase domain